MNHIIAVGINHKTSPIEIREQFYLRTIERELLLSELKNNPSVIEALVLSTCNRTEVYATLLEQNSALLLENLFRIKTPSPRADLKTHFYSYSNRQAVEYLLRVSAGLDSLILGEEQILGQIKEAVELSRKKGMMGKQFNILTNIAIRTGKKARNETAIACGGSSVSWAAVAMAQQMLGTLEGKSVLIIGTGKMGQLAINYLKNKGAEKVYVVNRTPCKALALAEQYDANAVPFWDVREVLTSADVCICSASAPHYLIENNLIEEVMAARRGKKLILIDISMPRNIDPKISGIKDVSLLTIDDLDKVIENNAKKRQSAIREVEEIIKQKVCEFERKQDKQALIENENIFLAR